MYQVPMSFALFVLILPLLQLNPVAPSVRISCLSDIIQDYWNFVLVKDNTVYTVVRLWHFTVLTLRVPHKLGCIDRFPTDCSPV